MANLGLAPESIEELQPLWETSNNQNCIGMYPSSRYRIELGGILAFLQIFSLVTFHSKSFSRSPVDTKNLSHELRSKSAPALTNLYVISMLNGMFSERGILVAAIQKSSGGAILATYSQVSAVFM